MTNSFGQPTVIVVAHNFDTSALFLVFWFATSFRLHRNILSVDKRLFVVDVGVFPRPMTVILRHDVIVVYVPRLYFEATNISLGNNNVVVDGTAAILPAKLVKHLPQFRVAKFIVISLENDWRDYM